MAEGKSYVFVQNDGPYGNERSYNGLRTTMALAEAVTEAREANAIAERESAYERYVAELSALQSRAFGSGDNRVIALRKKSGIGGAA